MDFAGVPARSSRCCGPLSLLTVVLLLTLGLLSAPAASAAPPTNFQTSLVIGSGLNGPSGFDIAPDGRIFILERSGTIKIFKNGVLLPTPFAVLPSEDTGDRGLIGIAFDPDFGVSNHYVYFYYTGHDLLNHLVRFSAADDVGTDGPLELFRTSSPSELLHVGGSIRFGPDGKLYFAVGDNGYGPNAQDLSNPHGKILRINRDGSIPADNPFVGQPGKLGSIWAYGMRNPWRFQFDSATGRLYDGDVGDFSWEEVNKIVKGGNYGWPLQEGLCTSGCTGFLNPIYTYPHAGESSAVTGGPVYRGGMFPPEYQGDYFFGDYARGFIKNADLDSNGDISSVHSFDDQAGSVVDLKVAPDGSLYYITYFPGALYRVSYNSTTHLPVANATADVTKGIEPLTVHFSSAGSQDPDGDSLSYLWDFGDGTSSTQANPTKTYATKGVYTVRLTVSAAGDQSQAQPIVIQVGLPPELTVSTPTEGQPYRAGDTITYNAFARDAAGLDLNDANIKTVVRLHHGTHFHPFAGPLTGRAGSFTIPTTGEASADTSYEVTVTATDGNGVSTSKVVNIFPRKSDLSLATSPTGLGLFLDGVPVSTPRTFTGVEGFQRELFAPNAAVASDGTPLQFGGWSDGKSIRHVVTTPDNDTTYTASYVPSQPFTGRYYNNTTFSGAPVLTRQDQNVNFAWGSGSPGPGIPADDFAVRWTKTQHFGAGRYQFTTVADDGVRLYIDGKRVIGQWQGPANTEFGYTADLGEGKHTIKMDYAEHGGDATAALSWDAAATQPSDTYRAEYWNFAGLPAIPGTTPDLSRDEAGIDNDWGSGSPGSAIGPDRFAARWTRTISVAPGDYEFSVTADDGVRLYVDGVRVIDKWIDQAAPATYRTTLPLDGGPHKVVVEYYENTGGAVARFSYAKVAEPAADTGYRAEYWNTPGATDPPAIPTGPADLQRQDETLDFDWGGGAPGAGIAADRFVARWTKTVTLSAGLYRFTGARDDGIRAYIDNVPIVDAWSSGNQTYSADKVVASGTHDLRVEYFEGGGDARAEFTYDRIGGVASDTAPPSAPPGLTASAAGPGRVDLIWPSSTDDVGVTGYRVERCQGAGCTNFAEVGTPPGATYSDTALSPSTTYRYRVRATDLAGNLSPYSAISAATTAAAGDTSPPSAPTGLAATAISTTRIDLTWTASADNVGVTGYRVERCQSNNCTNFVQVGTSTTTSFSSTGLTANTNYRFRVRAADAAGNLSPYSAIVARQTLAPDTTRPTAPTGLSGTGVSGTQINLAWTASTDNVGVTGYRVERCQGAACTNFAEVATPTGTTYSDPGRSPSTTYRYRVRAADAAGNLSTYSAIATATTPAGVDTSPPTAPGGLAGTAVSPTQINLGWTASTDNVGVTGYRVERCQGAGCTNFAQVGTATSTSFSSTGLQANTNYAFQVRAVDAAGNLSPYSNVSRTTTLAVPDTTPPSALVTAPAAGSVVSGNVTVSANASDNVGVAGVQFLLDGASLGAEDTTAPYSISWDTTAASNGVHTLQARARDTAGNLGTSSGSVTVTVSNQTQAPPAGLVAGWAFGESFGTTVNDVSGNGNTATLQNGPTWASGKYGGGLQFDGVNDYLSVLNSASVNLSGNAMTLSMWINPSAGGGDQVPFAKFWSGTMSSPFYQYGVELDGGTTPHMYFGTAGGLVGASMGSGLAVGQWSHLAIVFDGSQVRFYVNGNLVSSAPLAATITARDSLLQMGADARPSQFFKGSLDDVRVYNRAQSQSEVTSDMNTPLSAPASDPTAPSVAITSPVNDAVVSGNRTVTADATDDVGVAGVQFYLDGNPLGPEDTTAPFAANWDTRVSANGAHTLTARARDTDNKTKVSALVNVTVANSDGFQNQVLATGFDLPTNIEFLPDGRMLVAELAGKIKVLPPPYTTPEPGLFLQINNIGSAGVQQGIFDVALDPNFAINHYYYVFYTLGSPNVDRLSRFTANSGITGTDPNSELVLYQDPGIANSEHHGGAIVFGNDGKLYFTTGDHFAGSPSQDLNSPRGKVHRINPDGTVPTDNPFYDGAGPHWDSVWAYGLRNPYRAYYDSPTGRLLIGDVGGNVANSSEELDLGARGANYGWPDTEGPCSAPCTSPLYSYGHNGNNASITGGFVYHGTQFPNSMQGNYFFADYAQRWIKRLTFDANGNVSGVFNFEPANGDPTASAGDVVNLTEGPDGALYYVDLGYSDISGTFGVSKIRRIRYLQSNQAPVAITSANPTTGGQPLDVTFSSAGSNDPEGQPITYSWDFGDGTLSTAANPVHTYAQSGQYVVRLTVSDGANSSISTPITISVGNVPTATIDSPTDGATFRAGDVISYGAHATDPEDGNLPASAFTWNIDFLHDNHAHPGTAITGVKSGSFTIPTTGHDFEGNTRYRITLTVTDSNGLRDTKSVTVWPQKVNLPFDTLPSGLTLYIDGVARTTPFILDTLIGFNHTIEARDQSSGTGAYTFNSWSDGGGRLHTLVVPSVAQSYTATYSLASPPSGLMGAWGFNEGSGTTTADASGNGNTATLVNGPSWVTGKYGKGLSFDQINDYLSLANSSSLDISGNAMTMSMWINPGSISGDSVVLGKFWNAGMTSPYYQYGLELSGGKPQFYIGTAAGLTGAGMDTALALNQWSHLAIVFNGSQALFYLNGALVSSKSLNASLTARGRQLRTGADADTAQFYKGILDNVRIYNRALTPSDVQSDMNTGL
jgi:glucose/arabinose dehydrogenase/PKD repeat protein